MSSFSGTVFAFVDLTIMFRIPDKISDAHPFRIRLSAVGPVASHVLVSLGYEVAILIEIVDSLTAGSGPAARLPNMLRGQVPLNRSRPCYALLEFLGVEEGTHLPGANPNGYWYALARNHHADR